MFEVQMRVFGEIKGVQDPCKGAIGGQNQGISVG